MDNHFTDLRVDHSGNSHNDSFWPSFTDLMMVVVMIFLIVSSTVIIQNWELVRQLILTEQAEQAAIAQVESTLETNASLEERLAATEQLLAHARLMQLREKEKRKKSAQQLEKVNQELQLRINDARELGIKLQTALALNRSLNTSLSQAQQNQQESDQRIEQLRSDKERISETLAANQRTTENQQLRLTEANDTITRLKSERALHLEKAEEAQTQLLTQIGELETLRKENKSKTEAYSNLLAESDISQTQLSQLQEQYLTLKAQYDKLIRPARTTKGKNIASIRYYKDAGTKIIELKKPASQGFAVINATTLHQEMEQLSATYKDKLYVKVIIPENSGLTYNEAWKFTTEMLNQYDYYHQELPTTTTEGQ